MKTLFLSFPKLNISLTAPDEIIPDFQAAFFHSIRPATHLPPRHEYAIESAPNGFLLLKDGQLTGNFGSCFDLICRLEEDIENTLIRSIGDWVGFHAGAVMIGDAACVIPGNPDTGKTTTTFNLVEMGHIFLCEEVSPVDPETLLVYPYPQVLTLDGTYAEKHRSLYPVQNGELKILDSRMARYHPDAAGSDPVPLKTILMPAYGPSQTPGIEELTPGEVFTELLGYCFPPNRDDEHLFDSVIRICEAAEIFRLRTNSIQSMRELLKELVGPNPEL
ncbi:MAG: hypothetical protein HN366_13935 [Deltaproteobacteria bacterium]|jgi:hypothetical protein|nr:hypothetical protein [Deltaproteobacteria bacterium]